MIVSRLVLRKFIAAAITVAAAGPLADLAAAQSYAWKNVTIGGGGFVTGIVASPKQQDLMYARTEAGGLYRWDGGSSKWTPLMDWVGPRESNLLGIESIAIDPSDPNRLYVAAGKDTQAWAGNGVILKSGDRGQTFKRIEMQIKFGGGEEGRTVGERLAVDPAVPNVLLFGSRNDGLWRSTNGGEQWDKVGSFPVIAKTNGVGIAFVVFDPRAGAPGAMTQNIYAGVAVPGETMYRTTNGGTTWMPMYGQPPRILPHRAAVDERGVLYVTYTNVPGPQGISDGAVWKYTPDTQKWTNITPVAPSLESGRFGYGAITLDPRNPGTIMVATIGRGKDGEEIFRSTDSGNTWRTVSSFAIFNLESAPYLSFGKPTTNFGKWISDIRTDPFNPDRVLYANSSAVMGTDAISNLESDRPMTWTPRVAGMEMATANVLVSPPEGAILLSGLTEIGGFRHDALDASPKQGMFSDPVFTNTDSIDFAQQKPQLIVRVGSGQPGKRGAYSSDGGKTWQAFASEPRGSGGSGQVAISCEGQTIVWTARNCLPQFTTDFGKTWTPCKNLTAKAQVIADRESPGTFYATDSERLMFSADGGASFSRRENVVLPAGRGKLYAVPGKAGYLWLMAGKSGIFRSIDQGQRISRLDTIKEAQAFGVGAAAPGQDHPALYVIGTVGTVTGVFRSDNAGGTWVRINDDATQFGLLGQAITGDPRVYGRCYLGTVGRGVLWGEPKR